MLFIHYTNVCVCVFHFQEQNTWLEYHRATAM